MEPEEQPVKRGRGRPPGSRAAVLMHSCTMRFLPSDWEQLAALAEYWETSQAETVRRLIRQEYERQGLRKERE
jgi:hypothetical protein